jgi:hypothetical protein
MRHTPDRLGLLSGCVSALGLPCKADGRSGRCPGCRSLFSPGSVPNFWLAGSLHSHRKQARSGGRAAQVCISSAARPPDPVCGALLYTFLDESCFDVARLLPREDAVADATTNASRARPYWTLLTANREMSRQAARTRDAESESVLVLQLMGRPQDRKP